MLSSLAKRGERSTLRFVQQIAHFSNRTFGPHVFDENDTIVGAYTPVTKQLWNQRYKWNAETLAAAQPQTVLISKPPIPSEVHYPFSKDPVLREHFRNPWGGVRVGLLLEDCDSMAGFTAYQHIDDGNAASRPPVIVTATVEAIHFNPPPLHLDRDMKLSGKVIWTGKTSMDLRVEVRQEGDEAPPNMSALFTFVARDAITGKPQQINPVVPQTDEEIALFSSRQVVADVRKAARAKQQSYGSLSSAEQLAWTADLISKAHLKRDLPALTASNALLMPQTSLENTFTTQPQQRNIHGRIFGGFIMRRAFELAHSSAYLMAASRPRTVLMDQIEFKKPVDVGDLVRFRSRVLKTWDAPTPSEPSRGMIHIQVAASVMKPEAVQSYETNTFNFLFAVSRRKDPFNDGKLLSMPEVLPTTESEAHEVCLFYGPGSEERRKRWNGSIA